MIFKMRTKLKMYRDTSPLPPDKQKIKFGSGKGPSGFQEPTCTITVRGDVLLGSKIITALKKLSEESLV